MKQRLIVVGLLAILGTPALAAMQNVTLSIPGMTCAACPITVKAALNKVDGITRIDINYKKRQAIVTFDDQKIAVEDLTQATANTGYPSSLKNMGFPEEEKL